MAGRHGEIELPFGPELRRFRLGIEEWRAVQEKCDCGPPELLKRMAPLVRGIHARLPFAQLVQDDLLGSWRVDDVREVLLQGLIGGGMERTMAGVVVRAEFDGRFSLALVPLAYLIVEASISPPEDEPIPPGETEAAAKPGRRSRKARSASPT